MHTNRQKHHNEWLPHGISKAAEDEEYDPMCSAAVILKVGSYSDPEELQVCCSAQPSSTANPLPVLHNDVHTSPTPVPKPEHELLYMPRMDTPSAQQRPGRSQPQTKLPSQLHPALLSSLAHVHKACLA